MKKGYFSGEKFNQAETTKSGRGFIQHHFSGEKFNQAKTTKSGAGFTLVEMLVAMSIFVIVVTVISGIFVQAIRAQRRNLAYQELLDQTSYVMEYMSRSIRMAMKDDIKIWGYDSPFPPTGCLAGDKVNYEFDVPTQCFKFRNYKNECQEFCLVDIGGGKNKLVEIINRAAGGSEVDLISPNLNVSSFDVDPLYAAQPPADNLQPLVTIDLELEGREETKIRIKTSISQRNLDTQK